MLPRRTFFRPVLGLVLCALASACPPSGDQPAPPLPKVTFEPSDEYVVAAVGKPFTLTARLTNADGSPATGYQWAWVAAEPRGVKWRLDASSPSPGVERVTFTPPGHALNVVWGNLKTCGRKRDAPCFYENAADTPRVDVVVWGGPATRVNTAVTRADLVVGETRSLGAVALTGDASQGYFYSDDPLGFASANPAVVTVDDLGVMTARAAGDTVITVTAGSASTTVPAHVAAGAPAPMPVGLTPLAALRPAWVLAPDLRLVHHKSVAYNMALPPNDGPWLVSNASHGVNGFGSEELAYVGARRDSTAVGLMSLAHWTGSGFGFELIGERWDAAFDPMMAIDERGTLYVVYRSSNRNAYVLLERPAGARPGTERLRVLPPDLREPASLGLRARDYVFGSSFQRSAIVPRIGGGVWIAYLTYAAFDGDSAPNDTLPYTCEVGGLLAEVTDASLGVAQLFTHFWDPGARTCADGEQGASDRFLELVGDPTGGPPSPRFGDRPNYPGSVPYVMRWPPTPAELQAEGGRATWAGFDKWGYLAAGPRLAAVDRAGELLWRSAYDFHVTVTPDVIWPELGIFDPNAPRGSLERDFKGWASDGRRLAALLYGDVSESTMYSVAMVNVPRALRWTDGEDVGRRFSKDLNSPGLLDPPIVLGDGTRYFLSRNVGRCHLEERAVTGLWKSSAPGVRPELVIEQGSELVYSKPLQAQGSTLYVINQEASGSTMGFAVRRSTDGGASWQGASAYTGQPLSSKLRAWAVLPSGAGFALMATDLAPDFVLLSTPSVGTGPWTARSGFTAAQLQQWSVLWGGDESFGFAPDGAGNVWALVAAHGSARNGVLARKYSVAGALLDEVLLEVPVQRPAPGVTLPLANSAVVAGNGRLVVLSRELTGGPRWGLEAAVIDPSAKTLTVRVIASDGVGRVTPLVRLADGRVAVGAQRSEVLGTPSMGFDARRDRAVLWSSADGSTWSAPRELRPDGGNGQVVWSLAVEPDGKLLAVVGDDERIGSATPSLDERYFATANPACQAAALAPGLMRVDAP